MQQDEIVKQVILVRKDLNMPKGKIGAQCTHAYRAVTREAHRQLASLSATDPARAQAIQLELDTWHARDERTVVLAVHSEDELRSLHQKALEAGLVAALAVDNGVTMFKGEKTLTAAAFGPHAASRIDALTGHLKPL